MFIDSELINVCIKAYIRFHQEDFNGKRKWVSLEQKFEVPFEGVTLHGYIDAVYEQKKDLHVFETKTAGRVSTDMVDLLHTNFQTFYYLHGYFLLTGRFLKYTIYNVVRKFEGRPRQDETPIQFAARFEQDLKIRPDYYFQRFPTLISKDEYGDWVNHNLKPLLHDYKAWRDGGAPHYCNTTNCEGKYGSCDFLPICSRDSYEGFKQKDQNQNQNKNKEVKKYAKITN
jgi:hypothetical protein